MNPKFRATIIRFMNSYGSVIIPLTYDYEPLTVLRKCSMMNWM